MLAFRDIEDTIQLLVVKKALRSREYTVVVDRDRRVRLLLTHHRGIDSRRAGNDAIGRRVYSQGIGIAPVALCRYCQLPVLDQTALVDEVIQILASGSISFAVTLVSRPGSARISGFMQ